VHKRNKTLCEVGNKGFHPGSRAIQRHGDVIWYLDVEKEHKGDFIDGFLLNTTVYIEYQ
jgi:hypothetical protein